MEEEFRLRINVIDDSGAADVLTEEIVLGNISWNEFLLKVKCATGLENVVIRYYDEDGDVVLIGSEDELQEAFKVSRKMNNMLSIFVPPLPCGKTFILPEQLEKTTVSCDSALGKGRQQWLNQRAAENKLKKEKGFQSKKTEDDHCFHFEKKKMKTKSLDYNENRISKKFYKRIGTHVDSVLQATSADHCNHLSNQSRIDNNVRLCHPETGEAASGPLDAGNYYPPNWFLEYMNKFRKEIKEEVPKLAAEKTAKKVVRSIEGRHKCDEEFDTNFSTGLHDGVYCDNCQKAIVGIRYKCGNCTEYDLCETCENLDNIHDRSHVFIKIRVPLPKRKRIGWVAPLLKKNLYRVKMERPQDDAEKKWMKCKKYAKNVELQSDNYAYLQEKAQKIESEFNAAFIRDETVPDGTHMQPGTRFTKKWLVKNIGVRKWTIDTRLVMIEGLMNALVVTVPAPQLEPGEFGTISVDMVAPVEPGNYSSTWSLMKEDCHFGHQLWCSIIVDEKELPEPSEEHEIKECTYIFDCRTEEEEPLLNAISQFTDAENAPHSINIVSSDDDSKKVMQLETSYRPLQILSHPATPSNTPLDYTPPMTPVSQLEGCIFSLTVGEGNEMLPVYLHDIDNSLRVEDFIRFEDIYVPQGENSVEFTDSYRKEATDSDSSDDADFFIVPVPDCFRTDMPASTNASTSIKIRKGDSSKPNSGNWQDKSREKVQNSSIETKPDVEMSVENVCFPIENIFKNGSIDANNVSGKIEDERNQLNNSFSDEAKASCCEPSETAIDCSKDVEVNLISDKSNSFDRCVGVENGKENSSHEEYTATEPAAAAPAAENTVVMKTQLDEVVNPLADFGELAWNGARLVGAAAVSVAKTAKNIYQQMQAQSQYVPPKSNWMPPQNVWTPPVEKWTPPQSTWTPSSQQWVPPNMWTPTTTEWSSSATSSNPHQQLIDMGFANRERNAQLLEKHNNDVHAVISELIAENDNDWSVRRH